MAEDDEESMRKEGTEAAPLCFCFRAFDLFGNRT